MTTRLIRPYPRVDDKRDVDRWFNELRQSVQDIALDTASLPEGGGNLYYTYARSAQKVEPFKFTLAYNSAATVNLLNYAAGTLISYIVVEVTAAFNGVGSAMTTGISGDTARYSSATDVLLSLDGSHILDVEMLEAAAAQMILTFTPGTGATTGAANVYVYAAVPA